LIVDCAATANAVLMPSCRHRRQAGRCWSADAAAATAAVLLRRRHAVTKALPQHCHHCQCAADATVALPTAAALLPRCRRCRHAVAPAAASAAAAAALPPPPPLRCRQAAATAAVAFVCIFFIVAVIIAIAANDLS
jgi:hypothetical protein